MALTVRLAEPDKDMNKIFIGASEFANEVVYVEGVTPKGYSPEFFTAMERVVTQPNVHVLLAEEDGELVGGIGFTLVPYIWDNTKINFEEMFWWCKPDANPLAAIKLIKHAKQIAKDTGAKVLTFHSMTSSPLAVDRVYRKMGLVPVQTTYMGIL